MFLHGSLALISRNEVGERGPGKNRPLFHELKRVPPHFATRSSGLGALMARNVFMIFFLMLLAKPLYSRLPNADVTISGTVHDPSGALISEPKLTLKSSHTTDLVTLPTHYPP